VEGNTWKTISHQSLAKWIADNRRYDTLTLVLLSCSDMTSTQLLANQLVHYDTTATPRRNIRKIIGWDNEVELYENGYVDGYGVCRMFSPQLVGTKQPPTPSILADVIAPHGTNLLPDETIHYVVLGKNSPERDFILALKDPQVTAKQALNPDYLNKLANSWLTQTSLQHAFTIALSMEMLEEMTYKVVKQLFVELIQLFSKLYFAQCSFTGYCSDFNKKYFESKGIHRNLFLPHFVWLQYISSKELEIQGGRSAFEKNPLIQTTCLHDGLLVQVGESPYDIFTDDGEALFVKATLSLPSIQHTK
jgi:hypothetical protein